MLTVLILMVLMFSLKLKNKLTEKAQVTYIMKRTDGNCQGSTCRVVQFIILFY